MRGLTDGTILAVDYTILLQMFTQVLKYTVSGDFKCHIKLIIIIIIIVLVFASCISFIFHQRIV